MGVFTTVEVIMMNDDGDDTMNLFNLFQLYLLLVLLKQKNKTNNNKNQKEKKKKKWRQKKKVFNGQSKSISGILLFTNTILRMNSLVSWMMRVSIQQKGGSLFFSFFFF